MPRRDEPMPTDEMHQILAPIGTETMRALALYVTEYRRIQAESLPESVARMSAAPAVSDSTCDSWAEESSDDETSGSVEVEAIEVIAASGSESEATLEEDVLFVQVHAAIGASIGIGTNGEADSVEEERVKVEEVVEPSMRPTSPLQPPITPPPAAPPPRTAVRLCVRGAFLLEGETAAEALIRHRESAAWHTEMAAHLEVCSMSWAGPVTRSRARARPY